MKNRIPPPLIMIAMGALTWLISRTPVALPIALPFQLTVVAVFVACGLSVIAVAIYQFNKAMTTVNPLSPDSATALVDSGIFSYSRNPMYLGMLLILIGFAYKIGSIGGIAGPVLFVVLINELQIKPEERALATLFGDPYTDYLQRVRRWL